MENLPPAPLVPQPPYATHTNKNYLLIIVAVLFTIFGISLGYMMFGHRTTVKYVNDPIEVSPPPVDDRLYYNDDSSGYGYDSETAFAQARNTQRRSDVTSILNAIHQYMADNNGTPPTGITSVPKTIASGNSVYTIELCQALVPTYLANLPLDPSDPSGESDGIVNVCDQPTLQYNSGYRVMIDARQRIVVDAPYAELGQDITITR